MQKNPNAGYLGAWGVGQRGCPILKKDGTYAENNLKVINNYVKKYVVLEMYLKALEVCFPFWQARYALAALFCTFPKWHHSTPCKR